MTGLGHDLAQAVRQLRQRPALFAVVVLTLALGIGGNATIFSVAGAVLFDSLPVAEPDRLVLFQWVSGPSPRVGHLTGEWWRDGERVISSSFSHPAFEAFRQGSTTLGELFASAPLGRRNVSFGAAPELAEVQVVSGGYYAGLGVPALLGRAIEPSDDRPGAELRAVVSYAYWRSRFAADPDVIGRRGMIEGKPFTIVGVSAPRFQGTLQVGSSPDVSLAVSARAVLQPNSGFLSNPNWHWLQVMGRLRSGASRSEARAEMSVRFAGAWPQAAGDTPELRLESGRQGLTHLRKEQQPRILVLAGVAGLLLALTCASVAGLLLGRAAERSREIAIRAALGASRLRIVRQLLTESTLLATLGAALGLVLARWTKDLFAAGLLPAGVPPIELDARVLVFVAAVTIAASVLFGLAPALRLRDASLREATARPEPARLGSADALLATQVALSLVLLLGASLLLRTLHNLGRVDTGIAHDSLRLFKVQPGQDGAAEPRVLTRRLLERLRELPGVVAVGVSDHHLIEDKTDRTRIEVDGATRSETAVVLVNGIAGDFFSAMGIPLRAGRPPAAADGAASAREAVVNQALAREYFGGQSPLGRRVNGRVIVGVAGDATYGSLRDPARPTLFVSAFERASGSFSFEVRGRAEAPTPRQLQDAVREVAPGAVAHGFTTPRQQVERSLAPERLLAGVSSSFGVLALLLTGLGLYGATALATARRTREIGVRLALGARPAHVFELVLGQGMRVAAAGTVAGSAGALALAPLARSVLYGVEPLDPGTALSAAFVLGAGMLLACWIPARRALRIEAAAALRRE